MSDFYNYSSPDGLGMTSKRTRSRLVESLKKSGINDQKVLDAVLATPRHLFIDEALASHAYEDIALPIGFNQTISQPFIVALMIQAVISNRYDKLNTVLEIGTGSGYQAAVLAQIFQTVYTVERIKNLYESAKEKLTKLRIRNIKYLYNDGNLGWASCAPYDAIIVSCASVNIPQALLDQLNSDGGRLVIPININNHPEDHLQQLQVITRYNNKFDKVILDPVRFVPMLSGKQ
jgi:protein-L-isoaspartate(D-aspartate) O-methyltransferase